MYDNKFPTKEFILLFLLAIVLCTISEVVYYLFDTLYFKQPYVFDLKSRLVLFGSMMIVLLLFTISSSRSKYRIMNDRLMVKEQFLFFTIIDINIPIHSISNVTLSRDWNHWHKHIILQVGDAIYHLSAVTYKKKIYKELSEMVVQNKVRQSQVLFYKQTKDR